MVEVEVEVVGAVLVVNCTLQTTGGGRGLSVVGYYGRYECRGRGRG
jgi:hypothetical protein